MDKDKIMSELIDGFRKQNPKSWSHFEKSVQYLIRGGSHNLRLYSPFPFFDDKCFGSKVTDLDGRTYIDFWQGHFTNILGHNPSVVTEVLADSFRSGQGLVTGFPGSRQVELAELILKRIDAERIRFTTSGTLATMYASMLARSFTQREKILKVGGGWHGSQPYLLKGVSSFKQGLNQLESSGLPTGIGESVVVTKYNDIDDLEEKFSRYQDRIAAMIVEPIVGAGGLIFAQPDYIRKVRTLTEKYGALMIMDEVVSGFRFHAGVLSQRYGIKPDLVVLGKSIGGGLPIGALAGREDILMLCGPEAPPDRQVRFDGGTFSALPATIIAGTAFISHLIENESEIYPQMGRLGDKVRQGIEEVFRDHGQNVCCSGDGRPVVEHSSFVGVHFLVQDIGCVTSPEQAWNPDVVDCELREKIFKLAMILEGFHIFHGYGAVTAAHTEEEVMASLDAVRRIAERWSQ